MSRDSLLILVVEDDFLVAQALASDIRANGDKVVGPFSDVHDALQRVDWVQAAILDVRVQDETSFQVADSLKYSDVPFVFLTGYDRRQIPSRFDRCRIYSKPSCAAPLLHDLHKDFRARPCQQTDNMEWAVMELLAQARQLMPDAASAERIVEAVLLCAIREQSDGCHRSDLKGWLSELLYREFRARGRNYLH